MLILYKVFTGMKCRVFSRSKAVSLAIPQRGDVEGVKACFNKPEDIFSYRCRRHRHTLRCFLGFSFFIKMS